MLLAVTAAVSAVGPLLRPAAASPRLVVLSARAARFHARPMATHTVLAETAAIRRPALDTREYRLVRLANRLEALLVSDAATDKAAAALDVHVGHYQDPDALPGLAHFLEHLLFMGTEKYPGENDYGDYLSKHGGYSNAFTSHSNTNYYFEVNSGHLEGALDRFAQFFIAPLFLESCTERELMAVDSENKKNLQIDAWRLPQLKKTLCVSEANHPFAKFGTGNSQTLGTIPRAQGIDTRAELIEFHKRYYSANIMRLVVLGKEPLDTLTEWTVNMFQGVRNTDVAVPGKAITTNPWDIPGVNVAGTLIRAQTVKDLKSLELRWAIPATTEKWQSKPSGYISHLLGHEGAGSVLALLKDKGYATELIAGTQEPAHAFDFFTVTIMLTERGMHNVPEIVEIVFSYIALLRDSGLPQWINDEVALLCDIKFRFKEPGRVSSFASNQAEYLQREYPPEFVLGGSTLITEFDRDTVMAVLDALNDRVSITLTAPEFSDVELDRKETWYGTPYRVDPIPQDWMAQVRSPKTHGLHLPKPNPFLPEKLDVVRHDIKQAIPSLLHDAPALRLWRQVDDEFWVPKTALFLRLKSAQINVSPKHYVMTDLLTRYVEDALTEYSYDAVLTGLSSGVSSTADAIQITLYGFSDKLDALLDRIVSTAAGTVNKIDPVRFERRTQDLARTYRNWAKEAPYQHAMFGVRHVLQETLWTPEQKLSVIQSLTAAELQQYAAQFFKSVALESYLLGNAPDTATFQSLIQKVAHELQASSADVKLERHVVELPEGNHVIEIPGPDPSNVNSAIEWYVQICPASDLRLRALLGLFVHVTREQAFHVLRTTRQLGYLVFTDVHRAANWMGYRVLIQSERSPAFVEACIEHFLDRNVRKVLDEMTDADFAKQVGIFADLLREKHKNIYQRGLHHWSSITSNLYDFGYIEWLCSELEQLAKSDLVQFYQTYLVPQSAQRRKLAVHVVATQTKNDVPEDDDVAVPGLVAPVRVADRDAWKGSLRLRPAILGAPPA